MTFKKDNFSDPIYCVECAKRVFDSLRSRSTLEIIGENLFGFKLDSYEEELYDDEGCTGESETHYPTPVLDLAERFHNDADKMEVGIFTYLCKDYRSTVIASLVLIPAIGPEGRELHVLAEPDLRDAQVTLIGAHNQEPKHDNIGPHCLCNWGAHAGFVYNVELPSAGLRFSMRQSVALEELAYGYDKVTDLPIETEIADSFEGVCRDSGFTIEQDDKTDRYYAVIVPAERGYRPTDFEGFGKIETLFRHVRYVG